MLLKQLVKLCELSAIVTLLIICSVTFIPPCSAADMQIEGFQYARREDFAKALECFNAASKASPRSWQILQSIANCHMELWHYDAAISYLQKSIEVGGLHGSQCNNMAAIYQRRGELNKALSWLKLSCTVDPANASNLAILDIISKLENPEDSPNGSSLSSDYSASLVSFKGWPRKAMPIKVYVRKNPQIAAYFPAFTKIVQDSLDQWCKASGNAISYKFVNSQDSAQIVCDYTDRRELVSSEHELGLDGNCEALVNQDKGPGYVNIVILVKDDPGVPILKNQTLIIHSCLHEIGHALGMHGHSPSSNDIMFPVSTLNSSEQLSKRDQNTIRRLYKG